MSIEARDWFGAVIDFEIERHWAEAQAWVSELREQNPTADPDVLVNGLINDRARMAAFVGVGTGLLATIPAVGEVLAVGAVLPEAVYLAKVQVDVALAITLLYRVRATPDDVKGIMLTCFMLAIGAEFVKTHVRVAAERISAQVIRKALSALTETELYALLARVGVRASEGGILKAVPLVNVVLNPTMNYAQIRGFGWAAKKFLSPSFIMCGHCGAQTGKLNRFCPSCGRSFARAHA